MLNSKLNDVQKTRFIQDEMVRRSDNDVGFVSPFSSLGCDPMIRISDARSGVPYERFAQNILCRDLSQMLTNEVAVTLLCDHQNVLGRNHAVESVKSHLNERFPGAKNVQKLFGLRFTTHRPETAANAASHDYGVC